MLKTEPEQTWKPAEAARILKLSERTIRRMCEAGVLDAERFGLGHHGDWRIFSLRPRHDNGLPVMQQADEDISPIELAAHQRRRRR